MAITKTAKQIADEKFKAQLNAKINSLSSDKKIDLKNNKDKQAEIETAYKAYINKPVINKTGAFNQDAFNKKQEARNVTQANASTMPVNTATKVQAPVGAVGKAIEAEGTTKIVGTDTYKVVGGQYVKQPKKLSTITEAATIDNSGLNGNSDIQSNVNSFNGPAKTDIAKMAEETTGNLSEFDFSNGKGNIYTDTMGDLGENIKAVKSAAEQAKSKENIEKAILAEEKLKSILEPAMKGYSDNTQAFTKILDKVMEQNEISIANQRKIANGMRETAGVASLIAGSKMGPGMSESQIASLSKDISTGYQDAIAKAEGNYELARVNGWNNIKQMGIDGKTAKDLLTQVTSNLGLQIAEPFLLALAENKQNKNDVIDAIANLKTGVYEEQFKEAKDKSLTVEGQAQRAIAWEKGTPQERQAQLINAFPKDEQGNVKINMSPDEISKLVNNKSLDWNGVYNNLAYLNGLSEANRANIYALVSTGKMGIDEAIKKTKETSNINSSQIKNETKGETGSNIAKEKENKVYSQTEISNLNNKVITPKNNNDTIISKFKPAVIESLDKVKKLSPAKKTEAINRLNASNKEPAVKAAMIYYINK